MTKQEFDVSKLYESYVSLCNIDYNLMNFPELRRQAKALCEEVRSEYEKKYDELHGKVMDNQGV